MAEKYKVRRVERSAKKYFSKNVIKDVSNIYISKFKTELTMDKYSSIIKRVFNKSKATLRSQGKSMMTPRGKTDAHITTRGEHQKQVADIAEQIAGTLGLNPDLARLIAAHHDDGHTFNGHTGERIINIIGRIHNCGYTVHNALSIDMLESENILRKVREAIKNEYPNVPTEELNKVEEEIRLYVFDGILAHNGEGVDKEIWPQFGKTVEDVITEKNNCYEIKKYDKRIKPTSMEGAILRFADIIAYTRTDILDGFRIGLITGFDEEGVKSGKPIEEDKTEEYYQGYLKVIGTILSYNRKLGATLEENRVNLDLLSELNIDDENRFLSNIRNLKRNINIVNQRIREKEDLGQEDSEEIVKLREELTKLREELSIETVKYQEYEKKKIEVAREYLKKIPQEDRKDRVVDLMQDMFIKDLEEYSKDKDYIGFSPAMGEALFQLRDCNMNYIVKYTRRPFENKILPEATLKLVERFAQDLIDTGIIYNEIMGEELRAKNEHLGDLSRYQECQRNFEDKSEKNEAGKKDKYYYDRKVYHRCGKLIRFTPEKIGEICANALNSIQDIAKHDLEIINGKEEIENTLSERYKQKIEYLKGIIAEKKVDGQYMSDQEMLSIIIKDAQKNIEQIYAYAIAKEFVAGMSDDSIIDALEHTGIITEEIASNARNRRDTSEVTADKDAEALGQYWKNNSEGR